MCNWALGRSFVCIRESRINARMLIVAKVSRTPVRELLMTTAQSGIGAHASATHAPFG